MITYVDSNLFESPAKVLVNTVNTVGVMGRGIAKTFKEIYPEMFKQYQSFCKDGSLTVGKLWLYKTPHKWILNFPTKQHWRSKSRLEYIEAGLRKFANTYDRKSLLQVSFPMLGCGNGELDWEDVRPLMEQYLRPLPIDVYIHLYQRAKDFVPEHRDIETMKQWLQSEPRSLPFSEFWDDLVQAAGSSTVLVVADTTYSFSVTADKQQQRLVFSSENVDFELGQLELEAIWEFLRHVGSCAMGDFPEMTNTEWSCFTALINKLPYIKIHKWIGSNYGSEARTAISQIGRFMPQAPMQRDLMSA